MNFFEMLVLSKKLSFADGKVSLYGQEISIYPARSMMDYVRTISEDVESVKLIYATAKESMLEYREELSKAYDKSNGKDWLISTINLYGLGKIQYSTDSRALEGEITVENSPYSQYLKGSVKRPIDDVLRGVIAGTVSAVLGADYDALETECEALGSQKCKLIIGKNDSLKSGFASIAGSQIP